MIFIGGIGPRKKRLDVQPRICSNCGLSQAYLIRIDNYLSLFFIPVLRISKGQPLVQCERCGHTADESGRTQEPPLDLQATRCSRCGATLAGDFRYCPYCGGERSPHSRP
ncbi:MAG: zinc ribbon domain-containing protein [Deltaproteobacteria bacterium]|nr:MAG: zinc ribbon domain-containing protein [Deltaproteobacteria bacterium]